MTNDLARINGQLELLAMANCGPNTECTFSLQEIPYQGDLLKTLEVVFPAGIRYMDKKPYSTEDWQVATQRLDVDAALVLKSKINKWCFHMPYSPTLPGGDKVRDNIVDELANAIIGLVGANEIHEVFVDPPFWYEASWQDFAMVNRDHVYFLHFGVSD